MFSHYSLRTLEFAVILAVLFASVQCVTGSSPPPPQRENVDTYIRPVEVDIESAPSFDVPTPAEVLVEDVVDSANTAEVTDLGMASDEGEALPKGPCAVPEECPCDETKDCAVYDDMDLCAGLHLCNGGHCILHPGSEVECPVHSHSCKYYQCDPDLGLCLEQEKGNGETCDDSVPCTENDICLALECKGTDMVCDDENICTQDQCIEGDCIFEENCEDGNQCTADICQDDGSCIFEVINCDDENLCTLDNCVLTTGECTHQEVVCEDDDPCTDDLCVPGTGCSYPANEECNVDFEMVNEQIFEKKCVPCHAEGGTKRIFVGKPEKILSTPQNSQCQNLPGNLPYNLAACIFWLTTELSSMPPPWYQAETLLPSEWTQITYEQQYPLDEADLDLIQQWSEQGFAQ